MKFFKWADSVAKRLGWLDVGMVKIAVFGFTLFLAKMWPPLLSLEWYWYVLVFVLASLPPLMKAFKK
ncbi:MAG: hypothetical protein V1787_01165 [Candidatus Micrarchaeota archaeon]